MIVDIIIEVDLIPQEYEWRCPNCDTTNFVVSESYPPFSNCYDCGTEVMLKLKDLKRADG